MRLKASYIVAGGAVLVVVLLTLGPVWLRPHLGRPSINRFAAFAVLGAVLSYALPNHRRTVFLALVGSAALLVVFATPGLAQSSSTTTTTTRSTTSGATTDTTETYYVV